MTDTATVQILREAIARRRAAEENFRACARAHLAGSGDLASVAAASHELAEAREAFRAATMPESWE